MKLVELMESQQLEELGIWKGLKGAAQSIGRGIAAAPSAYSAARSTAAGQDKAKRIEKDLKNRFLMLAGGTGSKNFDDLSNFLDQFNFDKSGLVDPTGSGSDLDDLQLNQVLNQAVRKNFSRIIAAQQGQAVPIPTQTAGTAPSGNAPAATAQQSGVATQTSQATQAAQQSGQQSAQTASVPTATTMPTTATTPTAPSSVRSNALAQIRQSIQGLSIQDQRRLAAYLKNQVNVPE